MPSRELREVVDAVLRIGSQKGAAEELGLATSTLNDRLHRAKELNVPGAARALGEEAEPGSLKADIDRKKGKGWLELTGLTMPTEDEVMAKYGLDTAIWQVTRVVPNQWQGFYKKGVKGEESHEVVTMHSLRIYVERSVTPGLEIAAATLASRIKPLPRARRTTQRGFKPDDQMAVFGLYDAHIGALAWEGETDGNNDTDIAVARCKAAINDLITKLSKHPVKKMIVPFGNDFMHFDNERGETTSGRVVTDFDSRYGRVLVACHDVAAHLIDLCLEIADEVEIVYVGGNHDKLASLHIVHWLDQRYKDDQRVTVDVTMHPRKYRLWGSTLLGFAHGDRLVLQECYRHMAEESREHWATATCRELHFGDKHHRKQMNLTAIDTIGKVTLRQNPTIAPRDYWTQKMGFDAVRCADVWRYTRLGFVGMDTTYAEQQ